jgi:hypothetical protein
MPSTGAKKSCASSWRTRSTSTDGTGAIVHLLHELNAAPDAELAVDSMRVILDGLQADEDQQLLDANGADGVA